MNTSNLSLTKPGTAQSFCLPVVLLHPGERMAVVHGTATASEIDAWYGLTEGLSDSTVHWVFQDEFVPEVDATVRLVLSENGVALTVDESADFSGDLFWDVVVERSARRKGLLTFSGSVLRGPTLYELKDHLGNVTVVVSDRKLARDASGSVAEPVAYHAAQVRSARDFYPFGMAMPGRKFDTPAYRYGFNGMEGDDEWKGEGNMCDYGIRISDPRLGRFLSLDPDAPKYPSWTPYLFAADNPNRYVDILGRGPGDVVVIFAGADIFSVGLSGTGGSSDGYGSTISLQRMIGENYLGSGGESISVFKSEYWLTSFAFGKSATEHAMDKATQDAFDYISKFRNKSIVPEEDGSYCLKDLSESGNGKIIIYGYSYGGVLATHLTKRLKLENIDVELLITVDAAAGPLSESIDRRIPDNVKENLNIFQTKPSSIKSHGLPNEAIDPSKTRISNRNNTGKKVGIGIRRNVLVEHGTIDEISMRDVAFKILETLSRPNEKE